MSYILGKFRKITRSQFYKTYGICEQGNRKDFVVSTNSAIIRCLSDEIDRKYCASSVLLNRKQLRKYFSDTDK